MAFDKVIDSTLLDAGMTATANAIRKKTGSSSPVEWDSANGFKAAVEEIETDVGVELPELESPASENEVFLGREYINGSGQKRSGAFTIDEELAEQNELIPQIAAALRNKVAGIMLPELTNPAAATDLARGKELIDADGNVVTGTLYEYTEDSTPCIGHQNAEAFVNNPDGVPTLNIKGQITGNGVIRKDGWVQARLPLSEFGNATASQVVKGATFTSAEGLLMVGTLEAGSGDNADFIKMLERTAGEITVPKVCTTIGDYAFYYNAAVTSVALPDTVTSIGYRSFYQCTALSAIQLSASLDMIDSQAFYNCIGLTSLTFRSTPTSIASNAFGSCSNMKTINVPWAQGEVADAPWGATNATVNYNYTGEDA